jgi:hypothetical protein
MTDVTTRGIEDEIYSKFAAEAKRRRASICELTTTATISFISESTGPSYRIGDVEALSVSRTDLESLGGPVTLENNDMLESDETVDWPTFSWQVKEINKVDILIVPKGLSKFQVLTKSRIVSLIRAKK